MTTTGHLNTFKKCFHNNLNPFEDSKRGFVKMKNENKNSFWRICYSFLFLLFLLSFFFFFFFFFSFEMRATVHLFYPDLMQRFNYYQYRSRRYVHDLDFELFKRMTQYMTETFKISKRFLDELKTHSSPSPKISTMIDEMKISVITSSVGILKDPMYESIARFCRDLHTLCLTILSETEERVDVETIPQSHCSTLSYGGVTVSTQTEA